MSFISRFVILLVAVALSGPLFAGNVHLIPEPVSVTEKTGHFALSPATAGSPGASESRAESVG